MRRRRCIGTRLLPLPLALQEARQQRAESLAGPNLGELLLCGRIVTEPGLRQQIPGSAVGLAEINIAKLADDDATCPSGDRVLHHQRMHATAARPQSMPGRALSKCTLS